VTGLIDTIRSHILALPDLAKFAVVVAAIVGVPGLAARIRLPPMVGLLLFGVLLGPHVLGFFGEHRPIADFFAELGKLLLMFSAGLEIDIALFRRAQARSIIFGLFTTTVPLLFGTLLALGFGYALIPAIVVGSLLASHTLLSVPIVQRLGVIRLEPIVVTIGATVLSDTLSLIVFAVCVSMYTTGFSPEALAIQLIEIAIFVPLILIGLSRAGAWALSRMGSDEEAHFLLMLAVMAVAGAIADLINLPGIVGAFLAGLAVNSAVHDDPARVKLEFFGNALFIPSFFVVTGLVIDPVVFATDVVDHFGLALGLVVALLAGKWIAAAGSPFRLHAGRKVDNVGADFAGGGRNPGRRSGRLRHAQWGRAANAGRYDAQRGARIDAGHVHSQAGADGTLRARHAGWRGARCSADRRMNRQAVRSQRLACGHPVLARGSRQLV
jgi:Kef-type K+ transport system membrane component KefB